MLAVLLGMAGAARAGVVAGAVAGASVPLEPESGSSAGLDVGLLAGYRLDAAVLHLQPEIQLRFQREHLMLNLPIGATATFGALVGGGVYAHLVPPLNNQSGLGYDAGVLVELGVPKVSASLRAGYQHARPEAIQCDDCAQPASRWLSVVATAGVHF